MDILLTTYLASLVTVFVFMTGFWILSLIKKDAGIADIAWGLGFVLLAVVAGRINGLDHPREWLMLGLVMLWGFRLAGHIFIRNMGKKEDFRYNNWRKQYGKAWILRSYLQVFLLQGLFMLIIAASSLVVMSDANQARISWLDMLGLLVFGVGFLFETVGDWQLYQFKQSRPKKGSIMTTGLWKYTRHPNYFGEATLWWGLWLIALNVEFGIWAIVSPLLINYTLLFVSGLPMLEEKYKGNKAFAAYAKKTSPLIPWLPKA